MNRLFPGHSSGFLRVLLVGILSFAILTMPFAPAIAASAASAVPPNTTKASSDASPDEALANRLFVNKAAAPMTAPPAASSAPADQFKGASVESAVASPLSLLPNALLLPVGLFTVSMTVSAVANDDGDSKLDPTNGLGTAEQLTYTVTLDNQTGTDALNLTFDDTHPNTSVVAGSIQSTPVAFDQIVPAFNEDSPAVTITLSGQDPDGNLPSNAFSIVTPPAAAKATLGSVSAATCTNGVCTATVTYTPKPDVSGSDSFTFKVNDGTSDSNQVGTVSITVNAVNDVPTFTRRS